MTECSECGEEATFPDPIGCYPGLQLCKDCYIGEAEMHVYDLQDQIKATEESIRIAKGGAPKKKAKRKRRDA